VNRCGTIDRGRQTIEEKNMSFQDSGDTLFWNAEDPLADRSPIVSSLSSCSLEDFQDMHSTHSKFRRRGSARSLTSFTTDFSTATEPASNTSRNHAEKKYQKRRFMIFTKLLMKFLERKDPTVFGEARAVIQDCEQKKRRGEVGSVTESVRHPLKQVVGCNYWKQARNYLRKATNPVEQELEPLSPTEEPPEFSQMDLDFLEQSLLVVEPSSSPLSTQSRSSLAEEKKLRKQRFWMLIHVLMKYLESKDSSLYLRAKTTIEDCVKRNGNKEEGFQSLSGCVQTSIKQVVGMTYWRKAEAYLARILIQRADEDAANEHILDNLELLPQSPLHFDEPISWDLEQPKNEAYKGNGHDELEPPLGVAGYSKRRKFN